MKCALSLFFALLIFSCNDKEVPVPASKSPHTFDEVFDSFWWQINNKYNYWDIDTTDWDKVYRRYKPLFQTLDVSDETDILKSVQYFKEMTAGLIDGHFQLKFTSAVLPSMQAYSPSLIHKAGNPGFRQPMDFGPVVKKYLDPGYLAGSDITSSGNNQILSTLSGILHHDILYFSCNSFYLGNAMSSPSSPNAAVVQYFMDKLRYDWKSFQGVVIDLRGNGGGQSTDLNLVVGAFVSSPMHFGFSRSKLDNGKLNYTPWIAAYASPQTQHPDITIPIVLLIDRYTASVAELVTVALKKLPSTILVGERSYGATGLVVPDRIYNSGPFSINNHLNVQISSVAFKDVNNKVYEGIGIPPDYQVPFDIESIVQERDMQLEKAILLIRKNKAASIVN